MSDYLFDRSNSIEEQPHYKLEVLWRKTSEGVRIDRVFSQEVFLKLPDSIEGNPVTEIGPYCFSSTERFALEEGTLTSIGVSEEEELNEPTMPQAAGKYLEGVILPDSVKSLGNGTFYNCRNLKFLSIGNGLKSLGGDVFTNCLRLSNIILRASSEEKSGLPLILETIKTEVEVTFQPEDSFIECRMFFPECYEEFDDMITAHVFNRVIIGEGFRMRQCFQEHKIQFSKYDQCFAGSVKLEGDQEICRIAMNRLRWPVHLKEEDQKIYEQALEERLDEAVKLAIRHRNLEELEFICQHFKPEGNRLTQWIQACIQADWIEGNVTLMEEKQKSGSFAFKSFDFDDDML